MKRYATEQRALRRVDTLKKFGFWPAVIRMDDGFCIAYDPDPFEYLMR